MCHESSGAAISDAIGIGKGCVTLDDFEKTDAIFIIGQNPGTNHPRMLTSLEHAKKRGAKIVAVNPLPETGLMRVVNVISVSPSRDVKPGVARLQAAAHEAAKAENHQLSGTL
jgi:anaerobic selenocysteine-containing dehydrogenase